MHRFLINAGRKSKIITRVASGDDPTVHGFHRTESESRRYSIRRRILRKLRMAYVFRGERDPEFHFDVYAEEEYYPIRKFLAAIPEDTAAIVVHFYSSFINSRQLAEIAQHTSATIYWLMMDMAPLTGGCHYAWQCKGYTTGCGNCPALHSDETEDQSLSQFWLKSASLEGIDVRIIAASEWQFRQAKSSLLFRNRKIHKVLTAVDPAIFYPSDPRETRLELGLPAEGKYILFGSHYLNERRKGLDLFAAALQKLNDYLDVGYTEQVMVIIVGNGDLSVVSNSGWPYHHFGIVAHEIMAKIYRAATVFVCASIEDSGPTMINQAMMSGRPVISFEMGVALDLVIDGMTGHKVPVSDTDEMARRIASIIQSDELTLATLSETCRKVALTKCDPVRQMCELETIIYG
jgi:glycosyltransferase involved in cell wall biosynthesis